MIPQTRRLKHLCWKWEKLREAEMWQKKSIKNWQKWDSYAIFCVFSLACVCVVIAQDKPLKLNNKNTAKLYGDALVWTIVFIVIRIIWIGLLDFWVDWIDLVYSIDWLNGWIRYIICPKSYISYLIKVGLMKYLTI